MAVDLLSDVPKHVVLDAATGRVVSAVPVGEFGTLISNHNYCNSGEGCYHAGRTPYAHQGFFGTPGTFTGSWPYRSSWYTGRYTARACWVGACAQVALGPNTTATFGGTLVTGTSFRIY
ncbi:hypothetical protein Q5530_24645 [Saccharothrix sp. BKS2]|uniref:Uncharacterized protein n=1 Tax=Saccharothrix lopnurensis TaxID=1670621 RepID=A0ABW1PAB4_9PSEU